LFATVAFKVGATGAVSGALFVLLAGLMRTLARCEAPHLMATFAAPLALLAVIGSWIVLVALLGRKIDEAEREWWARLSALGTLAALGWIGVMATTLYVPGLLLASEPWVQKTITLSWLGTAVWSVITGKFVLPRMEGLSAKVVTMLAALASSVFLVGLVGVVALIVSVLVNSPSPLALSRNSPSLSAPSRDDLGLFNYHILGHYILGVNGTRTYDLLEVLVVVALFFVLATSLIDVNLFSLNAMYANRLTRCYLGASRAMSTWNDRWGGFELRLMCWGDGSGVPASGNHLVIIGIEPDSRLHIRIFDTNGHRVMDKDDSELSKTHPDAISALKQRLPGLLSRELSGDEKTEVITQVRSIAGQTRWGQDRDLRVEAGSPSLSDHSLLKGFDLQWMPSVDDVHGIPTPDKSQIIVARVKNVLHFRIVDSDGQMIVDTDEAKLTKQPVRIEDLSNRLKGLPPGHKLTESEKAQFIADIASFVDDTLLKRRPNPVTGFDPGDDIELSQLRIEGSDQGSSQYFGPHLLINTTLTLVGESSLSRQDRKGESFVLSPLHCGSKSVGYSKLKTPQEQGNAEPNLTLGRAIAISGAAVDPNMGYLQSAPFTAVLTLFNARLGYWIEKPRAVGWEAKSPKFGDLLLTEFFGRTDTRRDFVHLCDGAHFENLGVYELVRRRCRYIVAVDASEDCDASDDNLAKLIRLCRIDFGVRITIDTRPLAENKPDRLTRTHVAIGEIHYEDVDPCESPGMLVYVKSSLTGDETPDIQKYARKNTRFPHEFTDLRQAFDEEQFECYRCLGDHIAWDVFGGPVRQVDKDLLERKDDRYITAPETMPHSEYIPELFTAVEQRWSEVSETFSKVYAETNRAWSEIQQELSKSDHLKALSQDLYPEIRADGLAGIAPLSQAELHTVARMLALMENSWISLSLKRTSKLPVNRGWVNSFRRWVGTNTFRRAWPILRSEFSSDFVRFCEEQLHLTAAKPWSSRLLAKYPKLKSDDLDRGAIDIMDAEFAREWPEEHRENRGVTALVRRAFSQKGFDLLFLLSGLT
jgi:hypothetical protein